MTPLPIGLIAWKRPEYLTRTLAALARCEGVEHCVLMPHVEPGCDEVRSLIESWSACECRPTWNPERLGNSANIIAATRHAFALARFAAFLDDDVILSPDALRFWWWCEGRYRDDPTIGSATPYNRRHGDPPAPDESHAVRSRPWFHGLAWASWRDRFAAVDGRVGEYDGGGWDTSMNRELVGRLGLSEAYPLLARCNHVGLVSSVHSPDRHGPEWMLENHDAGHWAGNVDPGPGVWRDEAATTGTTRMITKTLGDHFPHLLADPRYAEVAGRPFDPSPGPAALRLRAPANSYTGYGQMVAHLAKGLEAGGIPVAWTPIGSVDEGRLPLDPWVKARVSGPTPGPGLVAHPPNLEPDDELRVDGEAALTMWESGRLRAAWVERLNTAKVVIVPCRWNAEGFAASGLTSPIRVVPLGIDPAVYHPGVGPAPDPAGPVVFGCAGRLAHGGIRKGIPDVIAAFLAAFPDDPGVRLEVKVWDDCPVEPPTDPRVRLIRDPLTDGQLAAWYRSLWAFVSASRAEGWGLQPHQAMACGTPVIAPIFGGMAEYLTPECGWPVAFDEVPVPEGTPFYGGLGNWCEPRRDSLVAQLRAAHDDPEARRCKGMAAAIRAAEFPWDRSGRELLAVLREFGLVAPPASIEAPAPNPHEARRLLALACDYRGPKVGCGCTKSFVCLAGKGHPIAGSDARQVYASDCLRCVSSP